MAPTTWTVFLKQLAISLLLATTLAGCGGGSSRFSVDAGGDVGGGNGNGGNGDGGNGGGGGGDKPTATVGGNVTGLKGTLVLRINSGSAIELATDGAFSISTGLTAGSSYTVGIVSQPSFPAQDCELANSSGTIDGDVTNVLVTCNDLAVAALQADAGPRHATLSWSAPSDATHFNVYLSSARNCDVANYSTCPDAELLADVSSPLKVRKLQNGQAYFFRVETVHTNGARGLSNEAGARPDQLAVQGHVSALERAANGTVYLGGAFSAIGLRAGAAAPLDQHSGRLAQADFPIVSDNGGAEIYAVASDGDGGWYIGGWFSQVGGVPRTNLAHVLADGKVDPDFDPSPDYQVAALAVFAGRLYVGGYFTHIAGQPRGGVVALDADNGQLLDWDLHQQGGAFAFAVTEDTLYIGGDLVSVQGRLFGGLAAVDATGKLRKQWKAITDEAVFALAVSGDTVYAAGAFNTVNGAPYNGIVAIERETGHPVSSWTPSFNSSVNALAVSGGTVYAGGAFTQVNGESRSYLAALDASGALTAWKPSVGSSVDAMAVAGDNVYVGGMLLGLRAIGSDGAPLPSWNSNVIVDSVFALAVDEDVVYAGGWETMTIGARRRMLAAIDSDGALLPWNPQPNSSVHALALDGATLYIGGDFSQVDGANRAHLAAFDTDGKLAAWTPQADKSVTALALSDGILYVGGDFDSITTDDSGTLPRRRLAAIDRFGQATPWDPHVIEGSIAALAVNDGVVYAGGYIDGIGRAPNIAGVRHFAAIDANTGTHVPGWEHRYNFKVHALQVHDDVVYIGGDFDRRDDLSTNVSPHYLDGISLLTGQPLFWDPRVNGPVRAFDSVDHLLYLGGDFTQAFGQPRGGLAAMKTPNGTIVGSGWAPPGKHNIRAIAAGPDVVHAGGEITTGDGALDIGVAVIDAASSNGSVSLSQ